MEKNKDENIDKDIEKDIGKDRYWYWMCNIKGLSNRKLLKLLEIYTDPCILYEAEESTIRNLEGISKDDIEKIWNSKENWNLTGEYEKLIRKNIRFVHRNSKDYPDRLKNIPDAPIGLYIKGELPIDELPSVAIVGARICSEYGRGIARKFGRELAESGVQIISGLARGIDSFAQSGALEGGGNTFGVFGCGVDECYPRENISLYMKIQKQGGILSEYSPGTKPLPYRFPERNRIISGLADVVLVVEAKEKSGSLITVDHALEQGRDVFAVPGRVTDALSGGCNQLIRQGAGIVISIEDIVNELSIVCKKIKKNSKKSNNLLATGENMVYSCLDLQPKSLNKILGEVPMSLQELLSILLSLEMKGYILEISKNNYIIRNSRINE